MASALRKQLKRQGLLALVFGSLVLAGCASKGPAEKAGEEIDDKVEDVKDAAEDVGDEIEDAVDDLDDK